jgi:hypothetical protein
MARRRISRPIALILALGALTALSGCYQRVVGAHGPNAASYDVYEKSGSDNVIDRTLDEWFGTGEEPRRRGGRR